MAVTDSVKASVDATIHSAQVNVLEMEIMGSTVEAWLIAIGIVVVTLVVLRFGRVRAISLLQRLATRTTTRMDDLFVVLIEKTRWFFFVVLALLAGSHALTLSPQVLAVTHKVVLLALVVQAALWANEALSFWLREVTTRRNDQDGQQATTVMALGFLGKILLWVTAILLALDNLGMNISTLVTGLGIGGVAVALAVQNILGDLFASLSIILDRPFVVGDFISIDAFSGTVEHVGLKTTQLRSLSGEQLVLSNADLLKSRIRNFKRMSERRIAVNLEVVHTTPVEKLMRIPRYIEEVVAGISKVRFERAHLKDLGSNGIAFETVYHVLDADYMVYANIHQMVNLGILSRFREEGIDLALPTRTIFVNGVPPK